jgi:uncharacterized repeat protein (TIGR01451 family)
LKTCTVSRNGAPRMIADGGGVAAQRQSRWIRLVKMWLAQIFLGLLIAHIPVAVQARCSDWLDKAYFNEFFFGPSGGGNPPNFLEVFSSDNAFPASWNGWSIDVYSSGGASPTNYPFTPNTVSACTKQGKSWATYSVAGGVDGKAGLVILKDAAGDPVDALVFDKNTPPDPWINDSNNWSMGFGNLYSNCSTLAGRLTTQAGNASGSPNQPNMLIVQNQGNKDYSRMPDGGGKPFFVTSSAGANTTYTTCSSNNTYFSKTATSPTVTPGGTMTFLLAFSNTGKNAIPGVVIADTVPPGLTDVTATPSTGSGSVGNPVVQNGVVTWTLDPLDEGSTATLTLTAKVPDNAPPSTDTVETIYTNNAQTIAGLSPAQSDSASVKVVSPNSASFLVTANNYSVCRGANAGGTPSAPIVTITAMSAANGTGLPLASFIGNVTLSTSTGHGTWSMVPGYAKGTLSGNVYTFAAADNGQAQLYLANNVAESLYVTATHAGATVMTGDLDSPITYASSTAAVAGTDVVVPTPYTAVAGRPHAVAATLSSCGGGAAATGSVPAKIWYTPSANHPSAATPTVSVSLNAGCTSQVLLTTAEPATNNITLTFAAGNPVSTSAVSLYLCTTDVGQYALNLKTDFMQAASQNFTVRPFALTVSGIATSAPLNNPGGQNSTDAVFTSAGSPFAMTFDAWRWASGADAETAVPPAVIGNGIPDGGAIFAQVSAANRTPGFSSNVAVKAQLNTPTPGTGAAGTLGASAALSVPVSGGTGTVSNAYYTEVGSFRLVGTGAAGTAVQDYLGAPGVNVPTLVFAANGMQNDIVGRFIPHHFDTEVTQGCAAGGFTYSGQPFQVTVIANRQGGGTTLNYGYAQGFARKTILSNGGAVTGFGSTNVVEPADFIAGIGTNDHIAFTFPTPLTAPATIALRAVDDDTPAVSSVGGTEGTTLIRSGRLLIDNTYGSELLDLPVNLSTQFWDGTRWVLNGSDSCTQLATLDLSLEYPLNGSLTNVNMDASHIVANGTFASGKGGVRLTKPASPQTLGGRGFVTLRSNLDYLQGSGRETFGIYKSRFIYLRERY